ncbi:MAG: LysM peptidoglycan-binding domain-containing protein [Gammaproteobacteria bacterium]|nr:MAG: LysM peptidoglycan-binding domain-containing protein [Gammaproteobacteria bacterium]
MESMKFNSLRKIASILVGLSGLMAISACQQISPIKNSITILGDSFSDNDTGYSELTKNETEQTLKRLQQIRQQLQKHHSLAYKGPIRHIWDRAHANYQIKYEDNLRIEKQATLLLRDPDYLYRVSRRAEPYVYYILQEIEKRGLPGEILLLPVIESAYRPNAVSRSRAVGLWQFIPSTARFLGMKQDKWYDARRDVVVSTQFALDYLTKLNKLFEGDWFLTLAAYNGGQGTIQRAIKRNRRLRKPTDYWSLKLPRETHNYVPRFLAASRIFANPQDYVVNIHPVANQPYFSSIDAGGQLELQLAADIAGITLDELSHLNPGYRRWATPPTGPHNLVIPLYSSNRFRQGLASLPQSKRMRWAQHTVKSGDTLSGIASTYRVSLTTLKQSNKITGSLIRVGDRLLVPVNPMKGTSKKLASRERDNRSKSQHQDSDFHTVRKGDTLWHIARLYKLDIKTLKSLNGLNKDSVIHPGQRLRIRAITSSTEVALSK